MKLKLSVLAMALSLTAFSTMADTPKLETKKDNESYAIGSSLGNHVANILKEQDKVGISQNKDLIKSGFLDALDGKSALTEEKIRELVQSVDAEYSAKAKKVLEDVAAKNLKEGEDFLAKNQKEEGIKVTSSGLQYKVITEGTGSHPKATDTVTVDYRGMLTDGTEFDTSYGKKPVDFPLNQVIPGWTEGIQLMTKGAKYKFFIPAKLGYGAQAVSSIPPNSVLVFDVELHSIDETK